MKKTGIILLTIFFICACSKNQHKCKSSTRLSKTSKSVEKRSLKDFIDIRKDSIEGFLIVKYKISKINNNAQFIKFRYFNFDDNIFPINGVSVINGRKFKSEKYTIINDSILILPVLANNNSLSVNILNLKTKELIATDIRTSMSFVWVSNVNGKSKFIVSDNPKINYNGENSVIFKYTMLMYEIKNGELQFVRKKTAELTEKISVNIDREFKLIYEIFHE